MSRASSDLVGRLSRRLHEELAERGIDGPLTIADLYQQLIPYRGVRGDLGVLELAEYEFALLRLLAGEAEDLRLADEGVRAELAAELASPNPILGIYRDYASARVEILGAPVRSLADAQEAKTERPDPPSPAPDLERDDVRDVAELVEDDDSAGVPLNGGDSALLEPLPELRYPQPGPAPADATRVMNRPSPPVPPLVSPQRPHTCATCREPLPDVDGLRFCPHCGADQTEVPCAQCGTPLREEWNFCIRCGTRRSAAPPSA